MIPRETPVDRLTLKDVSNSRSNNFGFLRFVFATVIILSHSFTILGAGPDPFFRISRGQTVSVGLAIHYFFIMSGFLVTASWIGAPRFWLFVKKRSLRLYPAVAVMSLFCVFVIGPLSVGRPIEYLHQLSVLSFLKALLYLHVPALPGVFTGVLPPPDVSHAVSNLSPVNIPMWSIGYQMRCYLFIAACGMLGFYRRRSVLLVIWGLAFATYLAMTLGHWDPFGKHALPILGALGLWPRLLTYYGLGMLFYVYREKIPYSTTLFVWCLILLAASCWWGLAITQPILGAYAVLYFAYNKAIPLQNFARKGDLSYGLYIYAWPIQMIIAQKFKPYLNAYTFFLAAWIITLGFAWLSNRFIEKPVARRSRAKSPAPIPVQNRTTEMAKPQPVS